MPPGKDQSHVEITDRSTRTTRQHRSRACQLLFLVEERHGESSGCNGRHVQQVKAEVEVEIGMDGRWRWMVKWDYLEPPEPEGPRSEAVSRQSPLNRQKMSDCEHLEKMGRGEEAEERRKVEMGEERTTLLALSLLTTMSTIVSLLD